MGVNRTSFILLLPHPLSTKEDELLSIYRLVIGLVAGLGMLIFGGLALMDSSVKCGSKVMQPGDTCTSTRKGVTTQRTYDEQRSSNRRIGVIMTAAGPVVVLVCGAALVGAVRKRRSRALPAGPVSPRA
jgi:hypothetical protein